MRSRLTLTVVVLAVAFCLTSYAQNVQFVNEDFAGATGIVPPTGWTVVMTTGTTGQGWRFDNPGGRGAAAPLNAPFAIADSDWAGVIPIDTSLISPTFNPAGASPVTLDFDQAHIPLLSTTNVLVDDGTSQTIVYTNSAGTAVPTHTTIDITAACGNSTTCRVIFQHLANFDWYQIIDNVIVAGPSSIDAGIVALTAPDPSTDACRALSAAETVAVTLVNNGGAALPSGTLLGIDYDVNFSGSPTFETLTLNTPLAPNATIPFTFTTPANLSGGGAQNLSVRVTLPGDGNPSNDTALFTTSDNFRVTTFPLNETFDGQGFVNGGTTVPANWINVQGENAGGPHSDWESRTGPTSTPNTGPSGDHTSGAGAYFYLDDTGEHASAELLTPCLDFAALSGPRLAFWLHSRSPSVAAANSLSVDVISFPGKIVVPDIFGPQANLTIGNAWQRQLVDLAPFAGSIVRLRFRGSSNNGLIIHDQVIDDITVADDVPGPGQAPQPGIAVMDINTAVAANLGDVASGTNGPFFAIGHVGGDLTFSFRGQPNLPFILLGGPLNPGVVSFQPIGQLDIGLPNGAGGVMGVSVIADGTNPNSPVVNLFTMPPTGIQQFTFPTPAGAAGAVIDMQCLMYGGFYGAGLSNTVSLSIP